MKRRAFLGSAVALAALGAGCTALSEDSRAGVVLTHVELGNGDDEPHAFDIVVRHDGEVVHWSTHELGVGEDSDEAVEIDGPDERGHVEVDVRVDGQWASTDLDTDEYDGEEVIAIVTYGVAAEGALRISRQISDR